MKKNLRFNEIFSLALMLSFFALPCQGQDQSQEQCATALSYEDLQKILLDASVIDKVKEIEAKKIKFLWCSLHDDTIIMPVKENRYQSEDIKKAGEGNYCWPKIDDHQKNDYHLIRLRGSSTVGHILAPNLAYQFLKKIGASEVKLISECDGMHTRVGGNVIGGNLGWIVFDILATDSKNAESLLNSEEKDGETMEIGMASTGLGKNDTTKSKNESYINKEHIATDMLSVIVNKINPIEKIDVGQLKNIVLGETDAINWSSLGQDISCKGSNNIIFYTRQYGSGSLTDFLTEIGLKEPELSKYLEKIKHLNSPDNKDLSKRIKIVNNHLEMAYRVAGDPCGIGYVSKPYADIAKPIGVELTTKKQVGLPHKLYFYYRKHYPNPQILNIIEKFIKYTINGDIGQGQQVIDEMGYDAPSNNQNQSNDFNCKTGVLPQGGTRAGSDILFQAYKTDIDADNMQVLNKVPSGIPSTAREIWVVGFADSSGDYNTNKLLSVDRASEVKNEIVKQDSYLQDKIKAIGCGVRLCGNETSKGRSNNRVVEVWWR